MNFKFSPGDVVTASWSGEHLEIIRRVHSLSYPAYVCRNEGTVPESDLTLLKCGSTVAL